LKKLPSGPEEIRADLDNHDGDQDGHEEPLGAVVGLEHIL
jgi:cell wall assembly regulator SMI1